MDKFTRKWITDNSIEEISNYSTGELTIRGLHYRLVSRGMTNTLQHYKRVVSAMIKARWDGLVAFETFSDHDRSMDGVTKYEDTNVYDEIDTAKDTIKAWMEIYFKNHWENQPYYPEVFIEKKALIGVFKPVCERHRIALGACKGYPSLTFLNEAAERFKEAESIGKTPLILYFGDYDPSGEDIPRSIKENLFNMGIYVEVRRIALMEEQVLEWNLPPAPVKVGDSRTAKWSGLGQVELDAVEPSKIKRLLKESIMEVFDEEIYSDLMNTQEQEKKTYVSELKNFVKNL